MIQFYSSDIAATHSLHDTEAAHCLRVLRMREGDKIVAIDGHGRRYSCVIIGTARHEVQLEIEDVVELPKHWGCRITLAVAPTKNIDRMEWLVEKAVEIGVDSIQLICCARSERKVVKRDRLEKIAVSAMKQSLKATLPEIGEMTDFNEFVNKVPSGDIKLMGYCSDLLPRLEMVREYRPGHDVTILIGPEGDFSPEEVLLAMEKGFVPVTMGESRLRTETAALYSLEAVHIINQLECKNR